MNTREADAQVADGLQRLVVGDLERADAIFAEVLAAMPRHGQANALRGAVAHRSGDLESARAHLERATDADGANPEHACNLAVVLCEMGRFGDAEAILKKLLSSRPGHLPARMNLGGILLELGRPEEALACFDRVAASKPDLPAAHRNANAALLALGRRPEAIEALLRYRALVPTDRDAAIEHAVLARDLGDAAGSAEAFREAAALAPLGPIMRMEQLYTLRQLCAWEEAAPLLAELQASRSCADLDGWVVPFFDLTLPLSPARMLADARKHASDVARGITPIVHPAARPRGERRLRVGYVSADFREHPLSHLMQGFFRHHDRDAFEVFLYSIGPNDGSDYRRRIEADAEHFVDLASSSVEGCVERIRGDELDVLVDLMGYTFHNRFAIFAHRPAPIQATYMGFAGTLGADCIDYQVVDRTIVPPELAPHFSESLVYLPDTYMVTDDEQPISDERVTRADCGLPEDAIVLACFNAPQKIEPEVFDTWMRILDRVPNAILWLAAMPEATQASLRARAESQGGQPERVVFAPRLKKAAHLARLRLADVVLDTFYFGAHTTAVDALWAGVPVVTCPGETFASRVGASVLGAIGMADLVAKDRAAYEALATTLAEDASLRAEVRDRLRKNRKTTALFDTKRFARSFERGLEAMVNARLAGEKPAIIDVP